MADAEDAWFDQEFGEPTRAGAAPDDELHAPLHRDKTKRQAVALAAALIVVLAAGFALGAFEDGATAPHPTQPRQPAIGAADQAALDAADRADGTALLGEQALLTGLDRLLAQRQVADAADEVVKAGEAGEADQGGATEPSATPDKPEPPAPRVAKAERPTPPKAATPPTTAPKAMPAEAEPRKAEPPKAEPAKPAPRKAEPPKAEPPKAVPAKAEPPKAEPPKAVPAKPAPRKAVPAKAEPAKPAPRKTVPAKAAPRKAVPAKAEPPATAEPPRAPATSDPAKASEAYAEANRLAKARDWKGAEAAYAKALKLSPGDLKARAGRGAALYELKRTAEARKELEAVLAANPYHSRALRLLGSIAQDQGRNAAAKRYYERYLTRYPNGRAAAEVQAILDEL